ncbi:MAG: putative DNA modification/repair radical SAM protein, partial [Alphaproteobacteria bacterium]|nr:putative DNA modification/repair radical SAM protein [Alphaproteobacteria bacterium]
MSEVLDKKLRILADAAKYDASCASAGAPKRKGGANGLGSSTGAGICHAYTPDGRCVSLLKILLTNYCLFDCAYCINRRSSNVQRARFTIEEVVNLTVAFYKRNYIEGLFLSSGIIRSPDYTMEQLMLVAKKLRKDHGFAGYIHLKTIPEASPWLIEQAGLFADRMSINLELPSEISLKKLAPEKNGDTITAAMGQMKERIIEAKEERRRFSPAGQSTQVIVGADDTPDATVLATTARLYGEYKLRRVYYSAFSPHQEASSMLPAKAPPLQRENRLYQADWLLRFYGFTVDEIAAGGEGGMLDLEIDPKLAWALK